MVWKTIDTFDDNGTTVALQQEYYMKNNTLIPRQSHRMVTVGKLI